MGKIAYYVSGHGYGHAVRASQVVEALSAKGNTVLVRGKVPTWLFAGGHFSGNVTVDIADVDSGPVQVDSMTTDVGKTLLRFKNYLDDIPSLVEREKVILEGFKPDVVVSDISPLGVETANAMSLPSIVVANFLWDWILEGYEKDDPAFLLLAKKLRGIYKKADRILKTPLSGGFDGYENVKDIPLIARGCELAKEETRDILNLPHDKPLALVAMGGDGLSEFTDNLKKRVSVCGLLMTDENSCDGEDVYSFDRVGVNYNHLLKACDVVIGKLGYGVVSEIMATGRPILYTRRNDFVEYDVLNESVLKYADGIETDRDTFFKGSLDQPLTEILKRKTKKPLVCNGAVCVVDYVNGFTVGK